MIPHTRITSKATKNVAGCPVTCAVTFENLVNQEVDLAGVMAIPHAGAIAPKIASGGGRVCQGIGSREWDRTTDHLHVKEVLYH